MKTALASALLLILFCTPVIPSASANVAVENAHKQLNPGYDTWDKFGRGLGNILMGWSEIPYQIREKGKTGHIMPAFATGLGKGVVRGFARTFVGVYELLTFPFSFPDNYSPIMHPEYLSYPAYVPAEDWPDWGENKGFRSEGI